MNPDIFFVYDQHSMRRIIFKNEKDSKTVGPKLFKYKVRVRNFKQWVLDIIFLPTKFDS